MVSGRRRGAGASLARLGLRLLEVPYTAAVRLRNRRYDRGRAAIHKMPVKVVSVGNLTLGGTGKTPMVQWIARWFSERGRRVVVVSRGYGAEGLKNKGATAGLSDSAGHPFPENTAGQAGSGTRTRANDEALELELKLPGVAHVENPDRVAAAAAAIERHGAEVVVLDDAFQHRRIARDLDVVLIDALEPFGFEHVFPRGTLREPVEGLGRAQVVALSRAEMLDAAAREAIRRRAAALAPQALWIEVSHAADALINAGGQRLPVSTLAARPVIAPPVAAFCGLGNPAGFRHTLAACCYRLAAFREFPDHHAYTPADVESLARWVEELSAGDDGPAAVVCTVKDLVKLRIDLLGNLPLYALSISLAFLSGEREFEEILDGGVRS